MWTLPSVPREEGQLSACVRNDDAAMGPLHNTTHETASCTSKSGWGTSCRIFLKFRKLVSAQGGYFLNRKASFCWLLLLGELLLFVFRKATFLLLCFLVFFGTKLCLSFFFAAVLLSFFSRRLVGMLLDGFFFFLPGCGHWVGVAVVEADVMTNV